MLKIYIRTHPQSWSHRTRPRKTGLPRTFSG